MIKGQLITYKQRLTVQTNPTTSPGSEVDWLHYCMGAPSSKVVDADSDEVVYEYKLRFEGEYHVYWKQTTPLPQPTWPCAAFDVIEAATE